MRHCEQERWDDTGCPTQLQDLQHLSKGLQIDDLLAHACQREAEQELQIDMNPKLAGLTVGMSNLSLPAIS